MEFGKDIISIAPDGTPCAFQLKGIDGGRMTLATWRRDLLPQMTSLTNTALIHPSLPPSATGVQHKSYLVVNGDLDEEVQHEIHSINSANVNAGYPNRIIETIVKGQLFSAFQELQSDFWATNLHDVKTYLELFLEDGSGVLPKQKLSSLFEDALSLSEDGAAKPANDLISRALAGCAVICAAAITSFTLRSNHLAEFEAWTLFRSYTMGVACRWDVPHATISDALSTADEAIFSSLARLCDELRNRQELVEGDPLTDRMVYPIRLTQLLGLISLYGLWIQERIRMGSREVETTHLDFAIRFCETHYKKTEIWGEYCLPQHLICNWFRRTYCADRSTDDKLGEMMQFIATHNQPDSPFPLPSPYYAPDDILPYLFKLKPEPLKDSFAGSSFYLEGIMQLFVRANYKVQLQNIFPDVTRISLREFQPDEPWQFFRYMNHVSGTACDKFLSPPHSWNALRIAAEESAGEGIPEKLRSDNPLHFLAMLLVMPHRVNPSALRWVATQLETRANDRSWQN
jgi:hypothetical protein